MKQSMSLAIILRQLDQVDAARSGVEDMSINDLSQLFFYLGEGGTGKSVVIKTLIRVL